MFWYQEESRLGRARGGGDAAKIIINKTEVCQLLNLVCDFDTEHQFRGCLRPSERLKRSRECGC